MQAFITCLERNSQVAKNITNLFDISEDDEDSDMVVNAKRTLKKGLYLTYIYTLWNCINDALGSKDIQNDLVKDNYVDSNFYKEVETVINYEFIVASKPFAEHVGTEKALQYIYAFAHYLETGELAHDLEIDFPTSQQPFVMYYDGAISKRVFDAIVKPMAHPIGWVDMYTKTISVVLQCFFGVEITTSIQEISLNYNEKWVFFISGTSHDEIYSKLREEVNPETKQVYTDDEISECVTIFTNKTVSSFNYYLDTSNYLNRVVVFTDNTVLFVEGSTGNTYYTTYVDFIEGIEDPLYTWEKNWEFTGEIFSNFKILYWSFIDEMELEVEVTKVRDSDGKVGNSVYMQDDWTKMFKIVGDEFLYVPGVDETQNNVENAYQIQEQLKEYYQEVPIGVWYSGTANVYDQVGLFHQYDIVSDDDTITLNPYNLRSNWNKIEAVYADGNESRFYLITNQAHRYGADLLLTDARVDGNTGTITFTGTRTANSYTTIYFRITSEVGINTWELEVDESDLSWEYTIDISDWVPTNCEYKFKIYNLTEHGHPINDLIYETNIFNQIDNNYIGIIQPVPPQTFNYEINEIDDIELMSGFDSNSPIEHVTLGELWDGSFEPPMEWTQDYVVDGTLNLDDLNGKYLVGATIEGSDYYNCYWWSTGYTEEETFIYAGWERNEIGTSDHFIMSSTRYVTEDFEALIPERLGYYLTTDINNSGDDDKEPGYYLYTRDLCYLYTTETVDTVEDRFYTVNVVVINGSIDSQYTQFTFNQDPYQIFTEELFERILSSIEPDSGYTDYEIDMGTVEVGNYVTQDGEIIINYILDNFYAILQHLCRN